MAGLPKSGLCVGVWPALMVSGPIRGLTFLRSDERRPVAPVVLPMMLWPRLLNGPDKSGSAELELPATIVLRKLTTLVPVFWMPPPAAIKTVLLTMVALLIATVLSVASPPPPRP